MPAADVTTRPRGAVVVAAASFGLLSLRPFVTGRATTVSLFALLLAVGVLWPIGRPTPTPARSGGLGPASALVALAVGVGAFALARLLEVGRSPVPRGGGYVLAVVLAAVAEEAFFRRFLYALLRGGGAGLAIGGTAVLFALAHVGVYGWWVFPLDLAAGLLLGWERWAADTWTVPLVTHVAANLLIVL